MTSTPAQRATRLSTSTLTSSSALYRAAFFSLAISLGGVSSEARAEVGVLDQVVSGQIDIQRPTINDTIVNQGSDRAVIDWKNFDILNGQSIEFRQPGATSVALNRITGGNATQIFGKLTANGRIVLINTSGIVFQPGSTVNVASLVASTADMSNADFNAGKLNFSTPGKVDASIVNKGTITAAQGGLVALVAPGVRNDGMIQADLGTVILGSAQTAAIDMYGDNLYSFAVGEKTKAAALDENGKKMDSAVENNGAVYAAGGKIILTANAAKEIVNNAVNNTGILEASSAKVVGGTVILGGGEGNVRVSGKVKAGGDITVTAGNDILIGTDSQNLVNGPAIRREKNVGKDGSTSLSTTSGKIELNAGNDITIVGNSNIVAANDRRTVVVGKSGNTTLTSETGEIIINAKNKIELTNTTVTTGGAVKIDPIDVILTGSNISGASVTIDPVTNLTLTNSSLTATAGDLTINNTGVFTSNTANSLNATGKISLRQSIAGSIQNAIDAVGNYATALLTLGTGNFAQSFALVDNSNFTVTGQGSTGASATVLTPTSAPVSNAAIFVQGGTNNTISNLAVDGSAAAGINGVRFENTTNGKLLGTSIHDVATAVLANNASGLNIDGNLIYNTGGNAVDVANSANAVISNNRIGFLSMLGAPEINGDVHRNMTKGAAGNIKGDAIRIANSNGVVAQNNDITRTFSTAENSGNGIHVTDSNDVLLGNVSDRSFRNRITEIAWNAIRVIGGERMRIATNAGADIARSALHVEGTKDIWVNGASFGRVAKDSSLGAYQIIDSSDLFMRNSSTSALSTGGASGLYLSNLTGTNSVSAGIFDSAASDGVTVRNVSNLTLADVGVRRSAGDAIDVANSAGVHILRSEIGFHPDGVTPVGPFVIKGDGIKVDSSNGAVITGNKITATQSTGGDIGSGIFVINSDDVRVGGPALADRNMLTNIDWDGIKLSGGNRITVENNSVDGVVRAGIYTGGTNTVNILNNDVTNTATNAVAGIESDGGSNFTISNNRVSNTVNGSGISMNNAGGTNLIDNNTVHDVAANAIRVRSTSGLNIDGNLIYNTGGNAIDVADSALAQIKNNFIGFINKFAAPLPAGEQHLLINKAGVGNIKGDGIRLANSNGAVIANNDITRTLSTGENIGNGIFVSNSNDVLMGNVSDRTFRNRLTEIAWNAIRVIGGRNVDIAATQGSDIARAAIHVQGVNDIWINGAAFSRVAKESSLGGYEILDSSDLFIRNSGTTALSTGGASGLYVSNLTGTNSITVNTMDSLASDGITVRNVSNLTLADNTVRRTAGDGIDVANSAGARILRNRVGFLHSNLPVGPFSIQGDGIKVDSSNGAVIAGNRVTNTQSTGFDVGSGIFVINSDDVRVGGPALADRNTITNIAWDGIKLSGGNRITVENNSVDGVVRAGIYTGGTNTVNILNNDVTNTATNAVAGIESDGGSNFTISNNRVSNTVNGSGISMNNAGGTNLIDNNTVNNVAVDGIQANNVSNLTITSNTISNAGRDGIHARNLYLTEGEDLWMLDARSDSASLLTGYQTIISGNTINDVARDGINLKSITNVYVADNTINDTGRDGINARDLRVTRERVRLGKDIAFSESALFDVIYDGAETVGRSIIVGNRINQNDKKIIASRIEEGSEAPVEAIHTSGRDGIHVVDSVNTLITENRIRNVNRDGIHARDLTVTETPVFGEFPIVNEAGETIGFEFGIVDTVLGESEISFNTIRNAGRDGINVRRTLESVIVESGDSELLTFGRIDGREGTVAGALSINDNTIRNVDRDGINVRNITDLSVATNSVKRAGRDGIRVKNSEAASITGNTVNGKPGRGAGIALYASNNSTVSNNTVTNKLLGFLFSGNDTVTVSGNTAESNGTGARIEGGANYTVSGNSFLTNLNEGLDASNVSTLTLSGNQFTGNATGLRTTFVSGLTSTGDTFTDNGIGAALRASNNAVLSGNIFTGNTIGIDLDSSDGTQIADTSITTTNPAGVGLRIFSSAPFSEESFIEGPGSELAFFEGEPRPKFIGFTGPSNAALSNVSFEGGNIAVLLDGPQSSLSFADNTNTFSNVNFYFVLQNNAMQGLTLDASQQTFDGVRATDFTLAQRDAAEAKTIDVEDSFTVGDVFYKDFSFDINIEGLDETQRNRRGLARRGLFSYAGRTLTNDPTLNNDTFQVADLNLSLLNRANPTTAANIANLFATLAPAAGGTNPQALANLSPSAGGPNAQALANLAPAAGGAGLVAGNDFLSDGYKTSFNTAQ